MQHVGTVRATTPLKVLHVDILLRPDELTMLPRLRHTLDVTLGGDAYSYWGMRRMEGNKQRVTIYGSGVSADRSEEGAVADTALGLEVFEAVCKIAASI